MDVGRGNRRPRADRVLKLGSALDEIETRASAAGRRNGVCVAEKVITCACIVHCAPYTGQQ